MSNDPKQGNAAEVHDIIFVCHMFQIWLALKVSVINFKWECHNYTIK
jgi:hypothetical protein